MQRVSFWVLLTAVFVSSRGLRAEEVVPRAQGLDFSVGADFRFRYEYKDNWMDKGQTSVSPQYEDFYRVRSRVWSQAKAGEDLAGYLRLGNEFRGYRNTTSDKNKNEFPDELFIDNLFLDFNAIGGRVDLRVGRQDLKEGEGRVVSDGTPGDGSRSRYFDSLLAKVNLLERSAVDLMGTWNRGRDDWTLGNPHDIYDLTRIRTGDPYSGMEEKGLMAYGHFNEIRDFPMEFYWIWKQETRFYDMSTRYPGRDFHTLGTRLVPKFTGKLSAEVEAAVQVGRVDGQAGMESRSIFAYLGYAGLTYAEREACCKPRLTGALLVLSGDGDSYYRTADGSADNGWNPVFNRTVWLSEIASCMYDQYRWSNLIYPHLETAVEPCAKHTVKLQTGPMFAAEKDSGAADPYRGYFTQLRYDFPLCEKIFGRRGGLTGAVVGETFCYGGYFQHDTAAVDEAAAYWLRFEVNGTF